MRSESISLIMKTTALLVLLLVIWQPAAGAEKKMDAWVVNQENPWGKYTFYVGKNVLRVDCSNGGSLIARAPDWESLIFNASNKDSCKLRLKYWRKRKGEIVRLDALRQKPQQCIVGGARALKYTFRVGARADESGGASGLFRAKVKTDFVEYRVVKFASNARSVPGEVILIWNSFYELPQSGAVPLEISDHIKGGGNNRILKTRSARHLSVSSRVFQSPDGLQPSKKPVMSILFGNQLEDAAELLLGY